MQAAGAGHSIFYENLLFTKGPKGKLDYLLRRLGNGAVILKDTTGDLNLIAANTNGINLEGLKTDAVIIFLSKKNLYTTSAKTIQLGDEKISPSNK